MNEPLGNIYLIESQHWLVLGFHQGKLLLIQIDSESNGQTYFFDNHNNQWAIVANTQLQPAIFTASTEPISMVNEATLLAIKEIKDISILCFKAYIQSMQN